MRPWFVALLFALQPVPAHAFVDDGGLEAIRKATEDATPGSRVDYQIKTRVTESALPDGAATEAKQDDQLVEARRTGHEKSTLNSFNGSLSASAEFNTGTSGWEDVTRYPETTVSMMGAPSVAPGTFYFEYGDASPCSTVSTASVSVPYTLAGPNSFVPLPLRNIYRCFRVRYVNGGTALTSLEIVTAHHWQAAKMLTRVMNQVIDDNEPVENVRAFIGGKSPNGPYQNLPSTGEVSSQSTMTPLAGGGVYNASGTVVDMSGYVASAVTLKSDVNSAANGLVFNWCADSACATILKTSTFTYGSAPLGGTFQVPRQGPFLRVTYTNGVTGQTTFTLSTRLFVTAPPSDVLAISETITGNTAAQIVKANIVGQQENGVYNNTQLSNSGSLKVAIADRPSEIRNRTRFVITAENTDPTGACTTLHTVTSGKTLYIQSMVITAINDSAANGRWGIYDNVTLKAPFILTSRATGTPASSAATSPPLPEPLPFTTNLRICELGGVVLVSLTLVGYEEPN